MMAHDLITFIIFMTTKCKANLNIIMKTNDNELGSKLVQELLYLNNYIVFLYFEKVEF